MAARVVGFGGCAASRLASSSQTCRSTSTRTVIFIIAPNVVQHRAVRGREGQLWAAPGGPQGTSLIRVPGRGDLRRGVPARGFDDDRTGDPRAPADDAAVVAAHN